MPEASVTENADTMAGQPEDTDINVADFSGYETVQKEFEKLCALEVRKLEEFLKKKDKLTEELTACDAKELALEIKMSVHVPKDIEAVKQLKSRLSETNTLLALEKERVSKGISDMERIGDQAGDIAEIMLTLGAQDTQSKLHIQEMARAAVKMVTDQVESFVKKD